MNQAVGHSGRRSGRGGDVFLYRGLSIGSMAIVAPISGSGVILPGIISLAAGCVAFISAGGMSTWPLN